VIPVIQRNDDAKEPADLGHQRLQAGSRIHS
jgi:hypothetical protein